MVRHYPKHLFTVSGFSKLKKAKLNLGNIGSNYYGTLSGDAVAPRKIFLAQNLCPRSYQNPEDDRPVGTYLRSNTSWKNRKWTNEPKNNYHKYRYCSKIPTVPYRTVAISNIPSTMNRKKGLAQKIQKMQPIFYAISFCTEWCKALVYLNFFQNCGKTATGKCILK